MCQNQRPWMTWKEHYALCFKTRASFGSHHENLNEDRPKLSATKMLPNDSRFWQHKVYADIRGGSQDLCKFSLDFMPIRPYITNTGTARRSRFQVQVFGL